MADKKISELAAATVVNDADLLTIVQAGVNKKADASLLKGGVVSPSLVNHIARFKDTVGGEEDTSLLYETSTFAAGGSALTSTENILSIYNQIGTPTSANEVAISLIRSLKRIDIVASGHIQLSAAGASGIIAADAQESIRLHGDLYGTQIGAGALEATVDAEFRINSTTKGFLPSRMTTLQGNGIISPSAGLQYFDLTIKADRIHNGTYWTSPFGALQDMFEPTGFPNSDDALVTVNEGTRTVTLTPASSEYFFYSHAIKHTKTVPDNIVFSDVEGKHAIYYNTSGVLQEVVNPTITQQENIVRLECYVANIYWDATNKKAIYWTGQNELHGLQMDGATHSNMHVTRGTQFLGGSALNTLSVDDVVPTNASAQFGVDLGFGLDEDRAFTDAAVGSTVGLPIYYLEGAPGLLRRSYNSGYSILTGGTGLPVFNEFTGGTYQNTEMTSGYHMWLFAFQSNNSPEGYICLLGSAQYNVLAEARDAVSDDLTVVLGRMGGIVENKVIAGVLIEAKSSYTNAVKARVVSTNKGDYEDFRFQDITSTVSPTQHGELAGLTEDDHMLYVLANPSTSRSSTIGGGIRFVDALGTTQPIPTQTAHGINATTHINFGHASITGTSGQDYLYCTVSGGNGCQAWHNYSTVGGGIGNFATGTSSVVSGGTSCNANGGNSAVGGGNLNNASGSFSTVPGGQTCFASGFSSFATNYNTIATHDYSSAFGDGTTAAGDAAFATGDGGTAAGNESFIYGQSSQTTASGDRSMAGGNACTVTQINAVAIGDNNNANAPQSLALGGTSNTSSGLNSVALGGISNTAGGTYSYAFGSGCSTAADLSWVGGSDVGLTAAAARSWAWGNDIGDIQPDLTNPDTFSIFPYGNGDLRVGVGDIASTFRGYIQSKNGLILALEDSLNQKGIRFRSNATDAVISTYSDIGADYSQLKLSSGTTNFYLERAVNRISVSGRIYAAGLPTSTSGLLTGELWVDTTASNVVKRV